MKIFAAALIVLAFPATAWGEATHELRAIFPQDAVVLKVAWHRSERRVLVSRADGSTAKASIAPASS